MSGPAALATDRTQLRPWREDEAERLLAIRSTPEIARWLSDPTPWTDLAQARERIARWADEVAAPDPFGVWAIVERATGVLAGSVSLHLLPDDVEVEIGWYLHPDATGRGLASEAAAALLAHAHACGVDRVWAVMWAHNAASARVAAAIGMTDLGVLHDPWYGTEECAVSRMFTSDRRAWTQAD